MSKSFTGKRTLMSTLVLRLGEHILACGTVSVLPLHLTDRRRSVCNHDLCRTNDTFSNNIPRLDNTKDRSFRYI